MNFVRCKLTVADPIRILEQIRLAGIPLLQVEQVDDFSCECLVPKSHFRSFRTLLDRKGGDVTVLKRVGPYWQLNRFLHRPILTGTVCLLLSLSFFLPTRVLMLEVEGNDKLATKQILEAAAQSGIHFGTSIRSVRSEEIKNRLLAQLPQLQWVGVNTYGCRAVIHVRERTQQPSSVSSTGLSSIVASRDGVITQCTVTKGNGLCTVGQAIRAGQTLISGVTDCGIKICTTDAEGEVFALTKRDFSVSSPKFCSRRQLNGKSTTRFSIIIGKKRINFFKGSGIYHGSCVKMYTRYVLTLPGGFHLPVALVKETVLFGELEDASRELPEEFLKTFADDYVQSQMVAGRILQTSGDTAELTDRYVYTGIYFCEEMIGIRRQEKIGD